MSLKSARAVAAALAAIFACLLATGCDKKAIPARATVPEQLLEGGELVFSDDFERAELGEQWTTTHAGWRIEAGELHDTNAKNVGLWLEQQLPERVRVEFDVRSEPTPGAKTFAGDAKCEIFAARPEHQAGYVIINGGWSNRLDVIARLDEHGGDRLAKDSVRVEPSVSYRWAVARTGSTLHFFRDGVLILSYPDAAPLTGRFFGFNNWESRLYLDNLAIYRLP